MKLDQDECYRAICAHDARYDGRFFTCVHTTGIYCRPVCPARVPKRENCLFVETAAAAVSLGFRACKRCRPEVKAGSPAWDLTATSLRRALRMINAGALDEQSMDEFADKLGLGARHLRRLVKTGLGVSPNRLALARRATFARGLVESSDLSMTAVAEASGFGSLRRFNDVMQKEFGSSPSALRGRTGAVRTDGVLALTLAGKGKLDWDALFAFFEMRAIPGVEIAHDGRYARLLSEGERVVRIEARADDTSGVRIELRGAEIADLFALTKRIRRAFDLDTDVVAVAKLLSADKLLGRLVKQIGPLRLPGAWDPFELSVRAMLGQQISVKAARTLAGRLAARFGVKRVNPGTDGLSVAFPQSGALASASVADIMALGLTTARAKALIYFSKAAEAGDLFTPAVSLEALIERFCALEGIGPWTAQYIALRAFGETDAFPASDLGLRKAYGALIGEMPSAAQLEKAAEAWSPWRGYAAQYLWTSLATSGSKEAIRELAA